ncbi:MAG: phenylalanine--tRNA ligase subunit alpha [Bacteroidetes bacterium]|nr:phenylalanine--tRNA ligase subunit alpha [Bacteroidota bacterium]
MLRNIEEILKENKKIEIKTSEDLEKFRLKYLSKNGILNSLFVEFKSIGGEEKKKYGKILNEFKSLIEKKYNENRKYIEETKKEEKNIIDYSLPGTPIKLGSLHPLSIVQNRIIDIFNKMGFVISEGNDIEDDWHNFSALNFPENHPARDMQDTFFISKEMALRTHTSSVQVRVMEKQKPPIRTISPGRVYRNEVVSARSNCFFHQIEGLYINKNVSFADLKFVLLKFVEEFFGKDIKIRFRPSYFPFTEPSAEMDIFLGTETEENKRLTKGTGWLEILGCGMVDENVLKNCGIDYEKFSGFAFGMGIERITMLKYGIKDIRMFFENDTRLLNQFAGL